jgi:hypothetical protein
VRTDVWKSAGRLAACAAALAACAPAWLILKYGVDVPYWDQWDIAPFFEKLARGTLTASDLFAQYNEYRQFFPNLLFVALGWLTGWNVRVEMLASLLLAFAVAFGVRRLGARTVAEPFRRELLFLLASLLIFSPMQYENWLFGVQVVYFMPAACVTSGLVVAYSERLGTRASVFACACLAAVATFSSANGVVCWLVLPLALVAARPDARSSWRRWLPLWGMCLVLCLVVYVYGYRTPPSPPVASEALAHLFNALVYFVALSGGPLALGPRPLAVAVAVGACALAAYVFACAYVLRFRDDAALVRRTGAWAALGAYTVTTALMVTAGRLGFGVAQSLSSRYTTYTLHLLVALVYLLPCVSEHAAARGGWLAGRASLLRRLGAGVAVCLVLAHVVAFVLVVRHGAEPMRRERLRAKACLLFVEVAPEERCIAERLYPDASALRERAGALDRLGYLRPPLVRDGRMKGLAAVGSGCSEGYGSFELTTAEGGVYVASGRARLPHRDEPADAVVLAYGLGEREQTAFALAEVGTVADAAGGDDGQAVWRKMFSGTGLTRAGLTAWAFDAAEGKAYRLCDAAPRPPPE